MTSTTLVCCRIHSFVFLSLRLIPSILYSIALRATLSLFIDALVNVSVSELFVITDRAHELITLHLRLMFMLILKTRYKFTEKATQLQFMAFEVYIIDDPFNDLSHYLYLCVIIDVIVIIFVFMFIFKPTFLDSSLNWLIKWFGVG